MSLALAAHARKCRPRRKHRHNRRQGKAKRSQRAHQLPLAQDYCVKYDNDRSFTSATRQTTTRLLVILRRKMAANTMLSTHKHFPVHACMHSRLIMKNSIHDPLAIVTAKLASTGPIMRKICNDGQTYAALYDIIPF